MSGALELRAAPTGLLDEPLVASVRGAGGQPLTWRARLRDDDGRVWRATAPSAEELAGRWAPAKSGPRVAALPSLRPLALDLRAEAEDGRGASRTVTRLLVAEGTRVRRWRDDTPATLFLPAERTSTSALLLDATGADALPAPALAALLASRGVLVLLVPAPRGGDPAALLERAAARLEEIAASPIERIAAGRLPLPPGLPATAAPDAAAWDELLARLGARPRQPAAGPPASA